MNYQNDESQVTIAIPTYNRSAYLDQCLQYMMPQVAETWPVFRVIIIDNQSTDNTWSVIEKYQARYPAHIKAIKNSENIGADANIAKCYDECNTRYAWIFGDDDVIMPGILKKIANTIIYNEYGLIHIKTFPYIGNDIKTTTEVTTGKKVYKEYSKKNTTDYLYEINDMLTFIGSNIINKTAVDASINTKEFIWTRINQIQWTISALLNRDNLLIDDSAIAINNNGDAGGYLFCKIFGTNFNIIFEKFIKSGTSRKYLDTINKRVIREKFPARIYSARMNGDVFYFDKNENFFDELKPHFSKYLYFWLFTVPMCKLPKAVLPIHFFAIRVFNRLYRYLR